MTRLIELLISILIVIVLFVVIALFLPNHGHVERRVEVGNPMSQVFDILNGFKQFNTWQPWHAMDPRANYTLEGSEFGEGAKIKWVSLLDQRVGTGSLTIRESDPEGRIVMDLDNAWRGTNKTSTFLVEQNAQTNAVTITWTIDVDYGWDLLGRYSGLYLNGGAGEQMNVGLGRLANVLATIPNVDYSQVEIGVVDVPATDLLYVGTSVPAAPRQWDEAEAGMNAAWAEVEAFAAKNNIAITGPRRRIINVLGEETNDFNLAIPVTPHTTEVTGNVRTATGLVGRAITTQYRGHRVGLQKSRDMLKAYAITHGYPFDRDFSNAWEEWLPDSEELAEPLTNLYLPIH
jgi:hypothetical protein